MNKEDNRRLRAVSGSVNSSRKIVSFLYLLGRDHLPLGTIEEIMMQCKTDEETLFSNGWLARYAGDLADRLED